MVSLATSRPPILDSAYDYVWHQLFAPETDLFYDYITDREPARRFHHLPNPGEIALDFPNPCGWGTGMEDCMLHAGSMIDVLAIRRKILGEINIDKAEQLIHGIQRCATVHGRRGFIARGISPHDGKSCYSNSSRDQFTLAVFGLWRFLQAYPDAAPSCRAAATAILRDVAVFCRTRITVDNGYSLGRLDGGPAVVSGMWNCAPHEMMRLPMFYAAAYLATGEDQFRTYAAEYAAPGLQATLQMDPDAYWWDIPLAQMLISLHFFAETRIFPELAEPLTEAMTRGAALAHRDLERKLGEAEHYPEPWETLNDNWRRLPLLLQPPETISADGGESRFGGKTYANPCFPPAFNLPNAFLRAFGNDLIAIVLGGGTPTARECGRLKSLLGRLDISRCGGSGPIQLQHGLWLACAGGMTL